MDASSSPSLASYPFLASLRFPRGPNAWTPYCSGVLIDAGLPALNGKLVLTAASCLYSRAAPTSPLTLDPLKSNPYVGSSCAGLAACWIEGRLGGCAQLRCERLPQVVFKSSVRDYDAIYWQGGAIFRSSYGVFPHPKAR